METIILRVVSKYLGLIVKNFTNEQAKLSLRKGEAALRDIEIDQEFFNKLLSSAAPMFALERATCSEIAVKVPWTRLKHDPIEVHLGNIELLISEHLFAADAANAHDAPTVGADAADAALRRQPSSDSSGVASEMSSNGSRSWSTMSRTRKYGFIDKIIDGVRVDFDRLVIRLQLLGLPSDADQHKSDHTTPDVLELVLTKGSFFQTDPAGDVVMLKQARSHFSTSEGIVIHKTFRCESVRLAMTRASGSCGYVHRFDVLEISPLVCRIKLRRLENGELQRVLGIVPLDRVEVDMSAPQLESLLVAVMSLLHALYRQDPNAAPVSTSDDAAVAALDNQSLLNAYNELRMSASKRLFESYMLCSLPPLSKGCTIIDVSVRSLCVRVRDDDDDDNDNGADVAVPAPTPRLGLHIDVDDDDAVVVDVESLNIGVVLPPSGSSIWPDPLQQRVQETVLSVVLQHVSISAPEPILSSKRDVAVRHHVASLDEPFPSPTNKTALDIKIMSRWPRPTPPVLSMHVDVRANLISLLADPDVCLRAVHTLLRPHALPSIRRFNELNPEQDNIDQLIRVELNGIHVCVPVPIPSAPSMPKKTASEFVASIGTLRNHTWMYVFVARTIDSQLNTDSTSSSVQQQQHATELYLNAGEVRLLPLEWSATGIDDASMESGPLVEQLLLRIETARLLSVQREESSGLHNHTSGFVERLVLETNAESLSCLQSVLQWSRMAVGDSEFVKCLQVQSGGKERKADPAIVSHSTSVQVCHLGLRNALANEIARIANGNELTLIVEHNNERTDVNLSCETLELDRNRERDDVNEAESAAAVYTKPFVKLSCERRDNGRSVFIQVSECGDDAPLRNPTTPTRAASTNGAALFTLSEFRNELNEMALALQNFVRVDSGAFLSPTASRVAATRTGRIPVTPSTKAAIIRFSQALALGDTGTMGSPLHAERMIEVAETPQADQCKLNSVLKDAVDDDQELKTPSVQLASQATPTTEFLSARFGFDADARKPDASIPIPLENVLVEDAMPCDHRMRLKDLALSELKNSKARRFAKETQGARQQAESAELVRSRVIVDRLRARNRILNTQLQMLNSRLSMALDSLRAERSRASEEKQMIIDDFSHTQEVLMNEVADLHLKLGAATKRLLRTGNTTSKDALLE